MVSCTNCGWVTAVELTWHGLCLACREYRWQNGGRDRPPPTDAAHVHRGETWPAASDPRVKDLVAHARSGP